MSLRVALGEKELASITLAGSGLRKSFFTNSGTEANEMAILRSAPAKNAVLAYDQSVVSETAHWRNGTVLRSLPALVADGANFRGRCGAPTDRALQKDSSWLIPNRISIFGFSLGGIVGTLSEPWDYTRLPNGTQDEIIRWMANWK